MLRQRGRGSGSGGGGGGGGGRSNKTSIDGNGNQVFAPMASLRYSSERMRAKQSKRRDMRSKIVDDPKKLNRVFHGRKEGIFAKCDQLAERTGCEWLAVMYNSNSGNLYVGTSPGYRVFSEHSHVTGFIGRVTAQLFDNSVHLKCRHERRGRKIADQQEGVYPQERVAAVAEGDNGGGGSAVASSPHPDDGDDKRPLSPPQPALRKRKRGDEYESSSAEEEDKERLEELVLGSKPKRRKTVSLDEQNERRNKKRRTQRRKDAKLREQEDLRYVNTYAGAPEAMSPESESSDDEEVRKMIRYKSEYMHNAVPERDTSMVTVQSPSESSCGGFRTVDSDEEMMMMATEADAPSDEFLSLTSPLTSSPKSDGTGRTNTKAKKRGTRKGRK